MKKVNYEMVYHFKEKLLLYLVFSLGFHLESNLKISAMAQRHSIP